MTSLPACLPLNPVLLPPFLTQPFSPHETKWSFKNITSDSSFHDSRHWLPKTVHLSCPLSPPLLWVAFLSSLCRINSQERALILSAHPTAQCWDRGGTQHLFNKRLVLGALFTEQMSRFFVGRHWVCFCRWNSSFCLCRKLENNLSQKKWKESSVGQETTVTGGCSSELHRQVLVFDVLGPVMLVQVTGEQAEGIYGERLQAADWCEVLGLGFSSDVSVGFLERARQHLLHKHLGFWTSRQHRVHSRPRG